MGEIADDILEGAYCESCGEPFDDEVGHPRKCDACKETIKVASNALYINIKHFLIDEGHRIISDKIIQHGQQVKTDKGVIVNVYNTCTILVQGKCPPELKKKLVHTRAPSRKNA